MAENAKIELITKSLSAATSRKLNKNDEYDYKGNFPEKKERTLAISQPTERMRAGPCEVGPGRRSTDDGSGEDRPSQGHGTGECCAIPILGRERCPYAASCRSAHQSWDSSADQVHRGF